MKERVRTYGVITRIRKSSHVLYLVFNWACIIVYVYQVYLWIREGSWTRIPSKALLPGATAWQPPVQSGLFAKLIYWILNVELAYTLCTLAVIFFALRWFADRQVK
jgi:hypothetical protein